MSTKITGGGNLVAGGNIVFGPAPQPQDLRGVFRAVDDNFRKAASSSGSVLRGKSLVAFSSGALFESLVRIGIPYDVAVEVPNSIIPFLKAHLDSHEGKVQITTLDIRTAVVQILTGLAFHSPPDMKITADLTQTWCSAYIRRYGSGTDFLKIIDHGHEVELNHDYIKQVFLPQLFKKVLGLENGEDAIVKYSDFFSEKTLDMMAAEIVRVTNTLNLYSINFKTLLYLVQDIVLQPPHPWIVNATTMKHVMDYNVERVLYHLHTISKPLASANPASFMASARECIVHQCACILTHYGCFLGVESKYGLGELMRVMKLKLHQKNIPMWNYCNLSTLEDDLVRAEKTLRAFELFLERISTCLYHPQPDKEFDRAKKYCGELLQITENLTRRTFDVEIAPPH